MRMKNADSDHIEEHMSYFSSSCISSGPLAVIECRECIPCNPCEKHCPHNAITIGNPITNLPVLDPDKCIGCGLCIPFCPGLAIFVINKLENEARISMPYEMLPMPNVNEIFNGCNRDGAVVTEARIVKVMHVPSFDKTAIVTIAVPVEYAMEVRSIRKKEE